MTPEEIQLLNYRLEIESLRSRLDTQTRMSNSLQEHGQSLLDDLSFIKGQRLTLLKTLLEIAEPVNCGCVPCRGDCYSNDSKALYFDGQQDMARECADKVISECSAKGENLYNEIHAKESQ